MKIKAMTLVKKFFANLQECEVYRTLKYYRVKKQRKERGKDRERKGNKYERQSR